MSKNTASAAPAAVREWATANGFEVGSRGKFSAALIKAYNSANGLKYRPGQHVPTVKVSAKPAKGRTVTRSVNIAEARAWARNVMPEGTVGTRGRLDSEILAAYVLHTSGK